MDVSYQVTIGLLIYYWLRVKHKDLIKAAVSGTEIVKRAMSVYVWMAYSLSRNSFMLDIN